MDILLLLTAFAAPAYTVRFGLAGLPLNALLAWVIIVWLVFFVYLIVTKQIRAFVKFKLKLPKRVWIPAGLLLLAGFISLAISEFTIESIGLFVVWFVQPISIFIIAKFIFDNKPESREAVTQGLYILLAALGFVAIFQFFSLQFLPEAYWGNGVEPKRAVGFFLHPNFLALFTAPLLAFLLPKTAEVVRSLSGRSRFADVGPILSWLLGAAALFLSLSRAGWLGLAAAFSVFVIVSGNKRIRLAFVGLVLIGVVAVLSNTNLRYRLLLPFYGEKSTVSRVSLWKTGIKGIKESPVFGLGLGGFSNEWTRLNTDPNIDSHNFPHNVFLNFWVETGLLGLISFLVIAGFALVRGFRNRKNVYVLGFALFLIAMMVQGIIDNPYFKNDLAMMFWLLMALSL